MHYNVLVSVKTYLLKNKLLLYCLSSVWDRGSSISCATRFYPLLFRFQTGPLARITSFTNVKSSLYNRKGVYIMFIQCLYASAERMDLLRPLFPFLSPRTLTSFNNGPYYILPEFYQVNTRKLLPFKIWRQSCIKLKWSKIWQGFVKHQWNKLSAKSNLNHKWLMHNAVMSTFDLSWWRHLNSTHRDVKLKSASNLCWLLGKQ